MSDQLSAFVAYWPLGQQPAVRTVGGADPVNHPQHYTAHPSGIECIQITEHMGFNLGNAVKYIWRADLKNDAIEDLRKAAWYLNREIARRLPQERPTLGAEGGVGAGECASRGGDCGGVETQPTPDHARAAVP